MANARASVLQARRGLTFGDKIKVLAPQNTGISSIAKQNAANETDIMIAKYNSGQIGNTEMKAFFTTQLNNPYVSASDKTQIQSKLLDFDVLIEKDRLESVFKQAPENSLQKAQAATALKEFYTKRASTMVAGTPAHSQALENAGVWQAQIQTIQESTNKLQRKNMQNQMLTQINQLPNSSSDKAMARAEMYKKLYDMAVTQGDTDDAQVYAANFEQEQTNAQQYTLAEEQKAGKAQRSDIINALNQAKNDYHDGKIDANTYYQILSQVNDYAVQNEDGTLQNTVNSETDRVAKLELKGGNKRTTVGSGLTAVIGKGGAGGVTTQADKNDFDFSDDIRILQELYTTGKIDQTTFMTKMNEKVSGREADLEARVNEALAIAQENPNTKIYLDGKKQRAEDVYNALSKTYDEVQGQKQALENGTFAILEIPPSQFTKAGAFKTSGKNKVTYEIVDTSTIPQDASIIADESGVLHMGSMGEQEITPEEYQRAKDTYKAEGYRRDAQTGKYYKPIGVQYDVFDPETGKKITQSEGEYGQGIRSFMSIINEEKQQLGLKEGDKFDISPEKAAQVNAQQTAMSAEEVRKSQDKALRIKQEAQKVPVEQKSFIQQAQEKAQGILPSIQKIPIPTIAKKVGEVTKPALQGLEDVAQGVQEGIGQQLGKIQTVAKPIVQEAKKVVSSPSVSNAPIPYVAPKIATAIQPVVKAVQSYNPVQTLQNNVQQATKAVQSYNPVQTFQTNVQSVKNAVQNIGTTIKNTASNIWNKLKWW